MKITFSIEDIQKTARKLIHEAYNKTFCFYGEMGSGKTTLIKALVKELGGADTANSPTFGIVNEYHKADGELLGYHFDFYRLENETEALDLGFEDYLSQDVWFFIEWPEKVASFLPEKTTNIYLEVVDGETRRLKVSEAGGTMHGAWRSQ